MMIFSPTKVNQVACQNTCKLLIELQLTVKENFTDHHLRIFVVEKVNFFCRAGCFGSSVFFTVFFFSLLKQNAKHL